MRIEKIRRLAGNPPFTKPNLKLKIDGILPELRCVVFYIETAGERAFIYTVFYPRFTRTYYHPISIVIKHKQRHIILTRIFYRDILPKIVHDEARDLFYEFYHPTLGEQEGLDELAKVAVYLRDKQAELRKRQGK